MPITRMLYPECGGDCLDSHKAFTVHYKMGEDLDLSYHYDNAEVTLNVSLGKEFSGGELFFGDMRQVYSTESIPLVLLEKKSDFIYQVNVSFVINVVFPLTKVSVN